MKYPIIVVVLLLITSAIFAQEGIYGPEEASTSILIAYEPTRFKTKLINAMVNLLDNGSRRIEVVNHQEGELEPLRASEFDVVFISNSGATAKVRPWIIEWLQDGHWNNDNIILHTTQTTVWTPEVEVDSITSASLTRNNQIQDLAEEYVDRIIRVE